MSKKNIKNLPASVYQKLLTKKETDKRNFSELLQDYAMDRFLYRWSQTEHTKNFVLKGAIMLRIWKVSTIRPTMDIDMLAKIKNDEGNMASIIKAVAAVDGKDGLRFDPESVQTELITKDAEYQGIRVNFTGYLDKAKIYMQVDIGFGDIIHPAPKMEALPAILDFPETKFMCYNRETSIAEKLQAAVKLDTYNSRMKDFFDIRALSRQFTFDQQELAEAIRKTFINRGTPIPKTGQLFSEKFIADHQLLWDGFRRKLGRDYVPESFAEVVTEIENFLRPVIKLANQLENKISMKEELKQIREKLKAPEITDKPEIKKGRKI